MSDGHLGACKECVKNGVKVRVKTKLLTDPEWVKNEKERCRKKALREYYSGRRPSRSRKRKQMKRYHEKYPEKYLANKFIGKKIKIKSGHHRHHWSYKKENWLDVFILSIKDHALIHRYLKYNPTEECYETMSGSLLDTRKKHDKFIKAILKAEQSSLN